jgi:CheY-like chemotaxis protein
MWPRRTAENSVRRPIVQRNNERYALDHVVELLAPGYRHRVAMHDVSHKGMFIAARAPLPVGARMAIAFEDDGGRVISAARVTHCLAENDARALARSPGIGIAFTDPSERFSNAVDRLVKRARTPATTRLRIVAGAAEPRLLERLSTALAALGFDVATANTGMELLAACERRTPNVVLVDRALPIFDGFQILERIACHDQLCAVPVIVMSSDPADLAPAFERGAADFIAKPFTIPEVTARTSRVARRDEPVAMSGSLTHLGLPALLTMLEMERTSGRLVLANGHAGWIDLQNGRVVGAGWSRGEGKPADIAMELLDWRHGTFKLTPSSTVRNSDMALPITGLLLERARLTDEASRPHPRPNKPTTVPPPRIVAG